MMLHLVPEILDPVDMVSGLNKARRMIDMVMSELRNIECFIAQKAIRVDNAIRVDCLSNDRNQAILLGIRNDDDMELSASLQKSRDGNLACCATTAFPFPRTAKVAFVDLNLS